MRISPGYFNTEKEIDSCLVALEKILSLPQETR